MVQGHIDDRRRPFVEVAVAGHRAETTVPALLDTGYEGHISLPLEVALVLGLELDSATKVKLADGSVKLELVFAGKVLWGNEWRDADILLTMLDEALIGTKLPDGHVVYLDFRENQVTIR